MQQGYHGFKIHRYYIIGFLENELSGERRNLSDLKFIIDDNIHKSNYEKNNAFFTPVSIICLQSKND
jgi:hypothetical protein